jgi:hypothetical protein
MRNLHAQYGAILYFRSPEHQMLIMERATVKMVTEKKRKCRFENGSKTVFLLVYFLYF